jgi:SAM-dependent methyltransferase
MTDPSARQRQHFDAIANQYAEARSGANHLAFKDLMWNEFLADKRALFGGSPAVLEPMCGAADGYDLLRQHLGIDIDYEGLDVSDAMIEVARAKHPDLKLSQADVTRLEPRGPYDVVLILGGLHHVPHAASQVVTTLGSAVRPGGYFLSWEPTHGNRLFKAVREAIYKRNAIFEPTTERAFEVRELFSMFEQAGFRRVDVLYPGLLGYVLYYNPDAFPHLNLGSPRMVSRLWKIERPFMRSWLARKLSFATLSLWQRQ